MPDWSNTSRVLIESKSSGVAATSLKAGLRSVGPKIVARFLVDILFFASFFLTLK
jgi:hypothetical protein